MYCTYEKTHEYNMMQTYCIHAGNNTEQEQMSYTPNSLHTYKHNNYTLQVVHRET